MSCRVGGWLDELWVRLSAAAACKAQCAVRMGTSCLPALHQLSCNGMIVHSRLRLGRAPIPEMLGTLDLNTFA